MREESNRTLKYLAVSLGLLLITVVTLVVFFMYRNSERIIQQNQRYLEDAAAQSVKNMNDIFQNASNSAAMVSHLYELQLSAPEFDYTLLDTMTEQTPFDYLRFVSPEGISYSGDGSEVNCRDREYFQKGFQNRSGVCYVSASRFNQEASLIFYTPLYYEGEIIGLVNGIIREPTLSAHLQARYFNVEAKSYLCLRNGTVVAASGQKNPPRNILESLRLSGLVTKDTLSQMAEAMEAGRSYRYRYSESGGTANAYLAGLPASDFMLLQTFPSEASRALTARANQDALWLEIALIAAFLLYLALVAVYAVRRNRTLAKEKEDLSQIVDSVKRLYRRFVVFDLENDSYQYLEEGNISLLGLPSQGRYSDWWKAFRAQYEAHPEYWGSMEDMEVEHLRQALSRENWFAHREYPVPDGRWERLSLIRLDMDEEIPTRVLGAVEDITEIKRRDEESRQALQVAFNTAEAANRAKSDFLSRMSHDIRTPMTAIIGLTAIMGTHLDDRDRIIDCLGKITSSSKHLLGLINEVLDMSKIESGKLVLSEAEFSLPTLVDDLLGIVQPTVNARHQELTVQLRDLVHEDVIGDSLRLQQVCVNILGNAVKYTGEGGHISLTISELPGKQPLLGEYVFMIEDDGMGMTPEFLERIFTPFERAGDERVSKIQGTGLGMSITRSIVQLMGGNITVESELGKGSRFTVHVSLKLQEVNEEAEERLLGLPVLVVDDDQVICESTCTLLDELGMHGEWVLTGREAVERVVDHRDRGEDFFAVILDWKMPEMDGLETARAIRREVGPDVPIIILSAYDWSEIEAEARTAGVNAFIVKPLFKSRLRGVFVNLISSSAPEEAANPLRAIQERDYTGRRALLVEDNELNQEIAKEILEMSGLTVHIAGNGKEGVETFAQSPPGYYDIIFMDVQMPIMNGYEATRAIRALPREDAKEVPILAMTANTFSEDVQAALDAGMNQHIAKPLDMEQLTTAMERWLG